MLKQDPMKYAKTEARRRARPQERRLRLLPIGVSKDEHDGWWQPLQ